MSFCMSTQVLCVQEPQRPEEGILLLKLEIKAAVNSVSVLGTEPGFPARALSALNHRASFLALVLFVFKRCF